MKTVLYLSLLLFVCSSLSAQQMSVKSFKKRPMDMEARTISPRKDQNGELAALIKIVTTEKGFGFDGGMMGVVGSQQKIGEVWVWLPKGIIKLTISHPQLGLLRDYFFPERIDAATTYEMVLTSGRVVTIVEESAGVQFFVLRYTPTDVNVDVYIDDVYIKGENGVVTQKLKSGRHTYKVQAPRYKQVDGVVEIGDERATVDIELKSSFGEVDFTSSPNNGAEVYINNEFAGKTPLTKELEHGEYSYRISTPRYKPAEGSVTIGETRATVNATLVSTFGFLNFTSQPENGAEVYINGEYAGTTPFVSKELEKGEYKIDIKSSLYLPHSQMVNVLSEGKQVNVAILLQPNFAIVNITVTTGCEVFVNDISKGSSNQELRLTPGFYTLEARKSSHRTARQTIEVVAGANQRITLAEPTPIYGTLEISANVVDAKVYLNAKDVGMTPNIINKVLTGTHNIEIKKDGYIDYEGQLTINEGKITTHSAVLEKIPAAVIDEFVVANMDLSNKMDWGNAVEGCRSYSEGRAGVGSWRLPTKSELGHIYEMRSKLEVINGFSSFMSNYFWSSTENQNNQTWYVYFGSGGVILGSKSINNRVRCVRDLTSGKSQSTQTYTPSSSTTAAKKPKKTYTPSSPSTTVKVPKAKVIYTPAPPKNKGYITLAITASHSLKVSDRNLGSKVPTGGFALNYTNETSHADHKNSSFKGAYYTWNQAKKACPSGWRLPTYKELEVIKRNMKYSNGTAYLSDSDGSKCYFPLSSCSGDPNVNGFYWSSSEYSGSYVWHLFVNTNSSDMRSGYSTSNGLSVRCVR